MEEVDSQGDLPRDVRLLHLLLASQSIQQYEDRVPLQLMDFAHRYTRGVLMDAMVYNDYASENAPGGSNAAANATNAKNAPKANTLGSGMTSNGGKNINVEDVRLAIAARTQYMFKPTAPKELLLQLAAERNKKALPQVMGSWGVRLPPEKYCLTAKSWDLDEKEEKWDIWEGTFSTNIKKRIHGI